MSSNEFPIVHVNLFVTASITNCYTITSPKVYEDEPIHLLSYSDHNKKVKCYLVVDEEFREDWGPDWQTWAISSFEVEDDPFEQKFGIDWQVSYLDGTWESNDNLKNIYYIYEDAKEHVGWDYWGDTDEEYEVLAIFFGQLSFENWIIAGLAEKNGNDFIVADEFLFIGQHEMSHLYDCDDHTGWSALNKWCVMSYVWGYFVTSWCDECTDSINENLYKW